MALHLKPSGETAHVSPKNGKTFSLEELQGFVSGYIEMVAVSSDRVLIINEEGRLKNLPYNDAASRLVHRQHEIVGDVLFCRLSEVE